MNSRAEPRRGRPRDPEADRRIREAAAGLLLEHGIDGMTVDAVAERAGVGKATLYRRWASKDELALAAAEALFGLEVRVPDTGTLLGDLTEVYTDLLRLAGGAEGRAFFRLAATEAGRDPRVGELYRISLGNRLAEAGVIFDRAIARGELPPDVDRQLMFDWPAGVILMRVLTGIRLPSVDEAAALARATVYGFGARS
ncbi:TetR/AcrR family transcriptional regulator [Jiangella alkaliphila]|uniref:DNA-binding transcriptional regulator, AcrR family n=1 Tax=Jiangella alkaliphila TaxID=419479 RepID=A0A1H2LA58_9ACTN|nr:TetR/AcrR family transcriptional regulator [Jiangella alkaliphila]SDU77346.1 DNA-binding transcriptional regulator, AcrR family [Jiangella alkaliphila]